ncbi:MAG: EAL domain-containing protein [Lachnospiraceae bacterium]|nr:EAL domain-containing protein [Lachnospiraceae bacterium]
MGKHSKSANKGIQKRRTKGFLFLCVLLLVLCGMAFFGLNELRKEMIVECENNLLWEVQLSAKEISESIETKFTALETIQEMVSLSYGFGPEAVTVLETSKNRYNMGALGIIDRDYTYYDNEGDVVPNTRTKNIDLAMEGNYVVARSQDDVLGDGVVFFLPYLEKDEVVGILYAKYEREKLLAELSVKPQDGTEIVVDSAGRMVLMGDDLGNYLEEISWEDFLQAGEEWKGKSAFDEDMKVKGCAVAAATNRFGKEIYFAAAQVDSHKDFFVVRLTSSEVVEKEIRDEMVRTYLLMALMAVFMVCIVLYAVISYLKNRKEVYNAAYVDALTGIPSKTKHKMDAQELIYRKETRYAYVTFDVDNFKYINEMFDYEYGNQILIHIGKVLRHFTKKDELYARISADNFAMLWEDTGTKNELTARIRELFQQIIQYREPEETLTVCELKFSCGVYRVDDITDINMIRANANLARTECKKRVLEDVVYYDEEMKQRRVEEKELEYEAKEALKNHEFLVYFQPKYDVENEKIIGAEALVRWNHPVRGVLSPNSFIPVFEFNGFVVELDLFVLDQVCGLIENWLKEGLCPICISVNLSRVHLHEQNLTERLLEVVHKHNVSPEYIEFELTESAFYEETESLLRVMAEIKQAGFRLSMDDFGSGYSSLNLLRRLPVDVLKLDKVFLEDCDGDADETRGKRIVMHVISMAKDLKMEVLAEGVETKGQKEFLQNARCDMIQGYYYARPMPLKEFEVLYKGQSCLQNTVHHPVVEPKEQNSADEGIESEA